MNEDFPPLEAYTDEPRANGHAPQEPPTPPAPPRKRIDWQSLDGRDPPAREWIIPYWIPHRHTTLLAGRGGVGKTLLAQHLGAALALGFEYVELLEPRRVLMWAAEDDEAELWRRQIHISSWMGRPLQALADRFSLHSYAGEDVTLMAPVSGSLMPTPMLGTLRQQVADYRAEVVILDNIARMYGGSENDRHAVTTFCAVVQGVCAPAAVVLLGHPSKALGSEYSGSTAWEGAVRARLYLSDRRPDEQADDDAPVDDAVRYLARRKANYSDRDIRRLTLADGVLIPAVVEAARTAPGGVFLRDVVRRAVQKLAASNVYGTGSTASPSYLPRLAKDYGLLENVTGKAFASAMREMILAKELVNQPIGTYSNGTRRQGLVIP
jgi:AAA domain